MERLSSHVLKQIVPRSLWNTQSGQKYLHAVQIVFRENRIARNPFKSKPTRHVSTKGAKMAAAIEQSRAAQNKKWLVLQPLKDEG